MIIRDYNGPGKWRANEVIQRYESLCRELGTPLAPVVPITHEEGDTQWIYPVMDPIIELAKNGDLAALELCLQLIEENAWMPFGMLIKSEAARAIKQQTNQLTRHQLNRIHARVTETEGKGYEFKAYAKLASRLEQTDKGSIP